ncbi:hypothetical protein NC653_006774 [Populus alba x Populus x berolinensis]|uniref:Uncharacterized protein n=1 Tax=Populus alba x Populus x berolinensis TaxID=444605 RepID=A0AAD6RF15_9ROSI|nr:hypothetical protein NC653_006774 [Populus alba x Populus x berolinensis]
MLGPLPFVDTHGISSNTFLTTFFVPFSATISLLDPFFSIVTPAGKPIFQLVLI